MTAYVFKRNVKLSFVFLVVMLAATAFAFSPTLAAAAEAVEDGGDNTTAWVCWAATVAFGFGAVGAAVAISNVGSAAMGAISERPEIATNALIFIALAEGLVVFGFITALMILGNA